MDRPKNSWDKILGVIAKGWGLKPSLVRAIVQVESSGNPKAIRYEPAFYERYVKGKGYQATEAHLLSSSWGLLQVVGLVARELGYEEHLSFLLLPELGLFWGCRKLAELATKYPDEQETIAAYNAGSPRRLKDGTFVNQEYVDKVATEMGKQEN